MPVRQSIGLDNFVTRADGYFRVRLSAKTDVKWRTTDTGKHQEPEIVRSHVDHCRKPSRQHIPRPAMYLALFT